MVRAQNALFDERIALVGLMLDSLLHRVHEVIQFEEALKFVREDLLDMKLRLESNNDAPSVIQKRIESAENESALGNKVKASIGDRAVIKAERVKVLNKIRRAVQKK